MFHIYENWTHDRCRVHFHGCPYANGGKGLHGAPSARNGRWHGPFSDRDTALRVAKSLGRSDTQPCNHCAP